MHINLHPDQTSFVEDALHSAEMNDAEELTPVSDDGTTVEAVGQETEEHTSDVTDDSALTDPSLEEPADEPQLQDCYHDHHHHDKDAVEFYQHHHENNQIHQLLDFRGTEDHLSTYRTMSHPNRQPLSQNGFDFDLIVGVLTLL